MAPHAKTDTAVKLTLKLSEDLYDTYAERAAKAGLGAESELVRTLTRCRDYNSTSPIYINDDIRNQLSVMSGTMIKSADDIVRLLQTLTTLKVASVDVTLPAIVIKRLESRCFGRTWPEMIRQTVQQLLEEFVGLR